MPASFQTSDLTIWAQDNVGVLVLGAILLVVFMRWLLKASASQARARQDPAARATQPPPALSDGDRHLVRELRKTIENMKEEASSLFSYFMILPDLTKRINSLKEKRKVAPLMIEMLDNIFDPRKILIFYANEVEQALYLGGAKGFGSASPVKLGDVVKYSEGRLGWMARSGTKDAMDRQNFELEERTSGMSFDLPEHQAFETELCAPIRHNNLLLGLISLGGIRRRPKAEKRMLEMVADLGALALNNIYQFNKIQAAANTDGLTQLHNKSYFQTRFAEDLGKAQQGRNPVSVFIFDIDHFKKYNDANGHLAGDECLKRAAKVVLGALREDDFAARYGGEEFVVVLPNTHRDGALQAAEKIRIAIEAEEFVPPHPVNPGGKVTISGGVATFPDDGVDANALISKADAGLYEAKREGRNRIRISTSQPQLSPIG